MPSVSVRIGAIAGALLFFPALAGAQGDAPPVASGDIDTRVKELEDTVRTLQETIRQLQESRETPKPTATPAPKPVAGWQDGFFLQSANGDFKLRVRGYTQADALFFPDHSGDTGSSTFFIRRARPILEGTVYKNIDFRVMPDFGSGAVSLQDAYADIRFRPQAALRVGKFKEPLSLERLQSDPELLFPERSIANNLAPNRDVGLQLFGDLSGGAVSYAVGVFNGVVDAGSSDGDAGDDKDFAARVFVQPFRNKAASPLQGLGLGVAATTGRQSESLNGAAFRSAGRAAYFRYDTAVAGDGRHSRFAPQFYFFRGPVGLEGEHITSRQAVRKGTARDTLTNRSWFLQGSYVLTGENASFRGVVPARPSGAIELAARYASFDVDGDAFGPGGYADPTVSAKNTDAWTLGVNWYLNRGVKAQFNYERTDFNRPLKFGSDTREHEDTLLSRLQVQF